jgi:hypothetical protein
MRKLLLSSIILLFFSCKSTYVERGNSSWHVQTNTQDQKKTKSEKHLKVISESTQQIIHKEKSPLIINESPGLKADIKESFAPVKTQLNQLRKVVRENKNPLTLKKEMIKTVRSKEFRKASSKNMGQRVGRYIIWGSLMLMVLGLAYDVEDGDGIIIAAIGFLLLIVGLLVLLVSTIVKKNHK